MNAFGNISESLTGAVANRFQYGNVSSWPDKLFANCHYGDDRIGYFSDNGNFFYSTEHFHWNSLESSLNNIIIANLVGIALTAAN